MRKHFDVKGELRGKMMKHIRNAAAAAVACASMILTSPSAFAMGGGNHVPDHGDPWKVNGLQFRTLGPTHSYEALGTYSFSRAINQFNSTGGDFFNAIGFLRYKKPNNSLVRATAYEIYGPSQADTIYYYDANRWSDSQPLTAQMRRLSGKTWRFEWSTDMGNYSQDATNNAGDLDAEKFYIGTLGSGCLTYVVNKLTDFIWRNKENNVWYYFGNSTHYPWGNSPTWKDPWGNTVNGGDTWHETLNCN